MRVFVCLVACGRWLLLFFLFVCFACSCYFSSFFVRLVAFYVWFVGLFVCLIRPFSVRLFVLFVLFRAFVRLLVCLVALFG